MSDSPEPSAPYDPRTDYADPPEIVMVDQRRVYCDGPEGPSGHPRVYYTIGEEGYVDCMYCDRRFVLRGGPADPSANGAA